MSIFAHLTRNIYRKFLKLGAQIRQRMEEKAKSLKNAGITSKKLKNDANCLNINVVTVTNDDKTEKCKTQRKAEYRKSTVFKSLPKKR